MVRLAQGLRPWALAGLQRPLLVMLLSPLILLALLNAWFDYRSADNVALQQDQRLLRMVPLLADSVMAEEARWRRPGAAAGPAGRGIPEGTAGVCRIQPSWTPTARRCGRKLAAAGCRPPRTSRIPQRGNGGTTWRIVRQRVQSVAGEITVVLADGSDPRQQWARRSCSRCCCPTWC
jgi:two-component system sensor histidine kinase TctE